MKSTANIKKTIFFILLSSLFFVSEAFAGYGMKIKDAYLTFYIEVDDEGMAKLSGLPLKGEYYYDTRKAQFIFTKEGYEKAYSFNVVPLERALPKARFSRNPGRDKMFIGFDTHSWGLSTNEVDCKEVFASQKLGEKMHFNMTDISRINIALAHITGQKLSNPCSVHVVSKAVGSLMGMPLHSYSLLDQSDFTVETLRDDKSLKKHKLHKEVEPLNNEIYAEYLSSLLTGFAYQSFLQTVDRLGDSGVTKVKALKRLLEEPENRLKIIPKLPQENKEGGK